MNWQIKLHDPSGETRVSRIRGPAKIGRGEDCAIALRDPSAPSVAAEIWSVQDLTPEGQSPYWIRSIPDGAVIRLGDTCVRDAQLPAHIPFVIGETVLEIVPVSPPSTTPTFPHTTAPWLTRTEAGAKVLWMAKKAANTPLSVYLAGETGVGKDVLAHLIHAWSDRASGPFVPLHCAALTLTLAESELFGHVKGSFTGAVQNRPGALVQAHGGTLFLDEVGDLPPDMQVKLLRFLENGEIRPVGADKSVRADVRLLCATHHPLKELVQQGKFRRDLYFRLASVTIEVPPLRSRPDDIELLALRFAKTLGKTLTEKALVRIKAHTWPGNVRELKHAIDRVSGLSGSLSKELREDDFDFLQDPDTDTLPPDQSSALSLEDMERRMIIKALRLSGGNRARASRILKIARSTLFEKMKKYKIQGPRTPARYF